MEKVLFYTVAKNGFSNTKGAEESKKEPQKRILEGSKNRLQQGTWCLACR